MHNADPESLHKTICKAWSLRNKYINHSTTSAYRLVNSYGDALPEVTIDVYNKNLLVQYFKSYEKHSKDRICSELNNILAPESITEKIRLKGEEIKTHLVSGKKIPGDFVVLENGIKFNISFLEGGGTGLFLDQRDNRKKIQALANNKEILNCFCYTSSDLENGIKFNISFLEGGGTGLFLDQRDNRKKIQALANNKEILNCFCYTSSFSIYTS